MSQDCYQAQTLLAVLWSTKQENPAMKATFQLRLIIPFGIVI